MSKNDDFLYVLKDELPQDFADNLRQQLREIEIEETFKASYSQWVFVAASIAIALFGFILLLNNSPDTDVLNIAQFPASLDNRGEITVDTIRHLQAIETLGNGFIRRIRLSPDGNTLLVDSTAGIYLHDANDLEAEPVHHISTGDFQVIDYASDGTIYGVIHDKGQNEGQSIGIMRLNPDNGEFSSLFNFEAIAADSFEISPDGNRLFVQVCLNENIGNNWCDENSWVTRIYDTESGIAGTEFTSQYQRSFPSYRQYDSVFDFYDVNLRDASLVHLSEDGTQYIYVTTDADGYIINHMSVDTGIVTPILFVPNYNDSVAIHWLNMTPDNQSLLVGGSQTSKVWNLERLLASNTLLNARIDSADNIVTLASWGVFFHPTEPKLVSINSSFVSQFDLREGEGYFPSQGNLANTGAHVQLAFNPSGNRLFGILASGEIARYSYPDGNLLDISSRYDAGSAYRFSFPDENTLMTTTNQLDGSLLRIWSLDDNNPQETIFEPDNIAPYAISPELAISPDGRYISYLGRSRASIDSGFYWLHDMETNRRYQVGGVFSGMDGIVLTDDTLIGIGGNIMHRLPIDGIIQNNPSNGETLYLEHDYRTNSLFLDGDSNIASDGSMMATISCTSYLQSSDNLCVWATILWDLETGEPEYAIHADSDTYSRDVSFSPDNQLLALSQCHLLEETECDYSVSIYNVSQLPANVSGDVLALDRNPLAIVQNIPHDISSIIFNPSISSDGSRIIALSNRSSLTTFVQILADGKVEQIATMPFGGNIEFSPDGNLVFSTNSRGQIEIWAVPGDGRTTSQISEEETTYTTITPDNISQAELIASTGQGHAYRIALSPDNRTLAIATHSGIYLHDANDLNAEAQFIGMPGRSVYYMEYTDNGDLYVLGWADTEEMGIYWWEGEPNQFQLIDYLNADWKIQTVDFSPDGNHLLYTTCVGDGGWYPSLMSFLTCTNPSTIEIHIFDLVNSDNNISIIPDNSANVRVNMSPDWSQLAYYDDGFIYLYDMATGEAHPVIETQIGTIIRSDYPDFRNSAILHFTPDGREVGFLRMSTGIFHSFLVDELNQVNIENPFTLLTDAATIEDLTSLLVFQPISNERLITRSDSIVVYSPEDEALITEFRQVGQVRDMLMNSDGSRLYVMSSTGLIQTLDWETRERIDINLDYSIGYNSVFTFSQDSTFFVNNSFTYDASVSFVWDVSSNELERQVFANDEQIANSISHSAISPDSRYVAYEMQESIYIYDRIENENRRLYPVANVRSIGFRDDGQLVVISSENINGDRGHIYNFTVEMIENGNVNYPLKYAVIDDTRFGYESDFPSTTSTLLPGAGILAVFQCDAFVEGGTMNNHCNQHLVKLIDTETGEILLEFEASMGITFISLELSHSNDGQYLFMGYCERDSSSYIQCRDNSDIVDIWRIEDLLDGNTEALRVSNLQATQDGINLMAYDDGSFLLTTSTWQARDDDENEINEPFVYFWSINADGEIEEVHRMNTRAVEFSPDSKRMVAMLDGQFQLWAVPEDSIVSNSD